METHSPGAHAPLIRLRSLGVVELRDAEGAPLEAVLTQPKRLALLFYLATAGRSAGRTFHRRDTLFDLLWRGLDQAHARAALNQSIYFLRRELGRDAIASRGQDDVAVEPSRVWCDAAAFETALGSGDRAAALALYGGELMPGFFLSETPGWERLLDDERARLRLRAATAARELADAAFREGEVEAAARWARRAVEVAPFDEVQLRRLLLLLARIGDRAGAVAAHEAAAIRFAADYEAELSATTRELVERIQAGEVKELEVAEAWPEAPARAIARPGIPAAPADEPTPTPASGDVPARRSWPAVAAGAAALLALGALAWAGVAPRDAGHEGPAAAVTPAPADRLAVLPIDGTQLDSARAYLAEAIARGLIDGLAEVAGIGVIAWSSVVSYGGESRASDGIGDRLGARFVLEGSLAPAGSRLALDLRLLEMPDSRVAWSDRFVLTPEDPAAPGGEVALAVARALSIDIDQDERDRLRDPGTTDPAARRAYLEGRYLIGRTGETAYREALARFREAIELDPTYALAWSGLSDAYDHLAGIGVMSSGEAYGRARSAAERALEIDPDLPEAHSSLAMALSHHYWMSEDAERHWRRALELKPGDARTRRTFAGHLRNFGRFDEALAHATIARDLDPIPFFSHFELLVIPYFEGRYEHVIREAERLAALDPNYGYAHFLRALALVQQERWDDALAALDAVDPDGTFADARLIRGYVAGARTDGRHDIATARAELARYESRPDATSYGFDRAVLHVALGEHERAIAALEEAYVASQFRLRILGYEPIFDPLRPDPRFQDLLVRIGLGETISSDGSVPRG